MNRTQAKRTWEAARAAGCKPLSWRLYDSLLDAARKGGTHTGNSGGAAFELERRGLVTVACPFAVVTEAGRAVLSQIAQSAAGTPRVWHAVVNASGHYVIEAHSEDQLSLAQERARHMQRATPEHEIRVEQIRQQRQPINGDFFKGSR